MGCSVCTISTFFLAVIFFVAAHTSTASTSDEAVRSAHLAWRSKSMKISTQNIHVKSESEEEEEEEEEKAKNTLLIPSTNCTEVTFNGGEVKYEKCLELNGGFRLFWDVSNHDEMSANVSIIFSGNFGDNWIGFGPSPEGEMVGSSVVISRPGTNGTTAKQYYLGGESPSKVAPGGNLTLYNIESELVNGTMTASFILNLNHEHLAKHLFIWANGTYDEAEGDTVQTHKTPYVGLISLSGNTSTVATEPESEYAEGPASAPTPAPSASASKDTSASISLRPSDALRSLIYGAAFLFVLLLA